MNGEFFPPMPDELVEAHAGRIGTFLGSHIGSPEALSHPEACRGGSPICG
jgi:hypothetical protein